MRVWMGSITRLWRSCSSWVLLVVIVTLHLFLRPHRPLLRCVAGSVAEKDYQIVTAWGEGWPSAAAARWRCFAAWCGSAFALLALVWLVVLVARPGPLRGGKSHAQEEGREEVRQERPRHRRQGEQVDPESKQGGGQHEPVKDALHTPVIPTRLPGPTLSPDCPCRSC